MDYNSFILLLLVLYEFENHKGIYDTICKKFKGIFDFKQIGKFCFFNANYMYFRFNKLACYLYHMINHT